MLGRTLEIRIGYEIKFLICLFCDCSGLAIFRLFFFFKVFKFKLTLKMQMQSKPRVELRFKVKILYKMSNWDKDSGWSRKKNRLITLGHHTADIYVVDINTFVHLAYNFCCVPLLKHSFQKLLSSTVNCEVDLLEVVCYNIY